MLPSGRYQRERNDIQSRINTEKKILKSRIANKEDEQIVKNIENSVKQIQMDFESEVKTLSKNINREKLKSFSFLRLSGRNGVTVDMPPLSRMDGYIQQLRNARTTNGRVPDALQEMVTQLSEARTAITGSPSS